MVSRRVTRILDPTIRFISEERPVLYDGIRCGCLNQFQCIMPDSPLNIQDVDGGPKVGGRPSKRAALSTTVCDVSELFELK